MKKVLLTGMSLIMTVSSVTTYAEQPQPIGVSVVGGTGRGNTGFLSAGNYDIKQTQQDTTQLLSQAMNHLSKMQEIDRDYLLEVNNRLLANFQKMLKLGQDFNELGQKSAQGPITLKEYLDKINQIKIADQMLTSEIQALTLITRETLPAQTAVSVGGVSAEMGSTGNLNLKPIAEKYTGLKNDLLAEMNAVKFPHVMHNNQHREFLANALKPDLSGLQVMTPAEVAKKTEEMNTLLALEGSTLQMQTDYVSRLRTLLRTFTKGYGTDESYRFRNENDKTAKIEAWKNLQDAFFRRSYLRRKYGIPMGALRTVDYKKRIANIENFTSSFTSVNEYLMMIEEQPAISRDEVMTAFENARNFVEQFDLRLTPVFKSSEEIIAQKEKEKEKTMVEYSSKDTGLLVRAASAVNFLTGSGSTAEVMLVVMRMVVADAREEMMVLQNNQPELVSYYNQRYQATAETKIATLKRTCELDFTLSEAAHKANCVPLKVERKATAPRGNPGNDISGLFIGILNQFDGVEKKKAIEADNIRQLIALANAAGNTKESEEQDNDLFK